MRIANHDGRLVLVSASGKDAGVGVDVETASGGKFSLAKSFPGFGPTGPAVVTPDELADCDDLAIWCELDGETMQDARTSQMILNVPQLVVHLSSVLTLLPGDIIFTGTPSGVGQARDPQRFITPGCTLVSGIEGLGQIETKFVA